MKTKKLLFILSLFLSCVHFVSGQTTITIGSGTSQGNKFPVAPYYGYSYTQQIILQSEIANSGQINKIRFYSLASDLSNSNEWTIYLSHTNQSEFSSSTSWITTDLTEVFSGTITNVSSAGWMEITLDTPFMYNNTDNLLISVDENSGGYNGGSSTNHFRFFTPSPSSNRSIYYHSDSTNPNPQSPPSGTTKTYMSQMQFDMGAPPSCLQPTALSSTSITGTSASISWTDANTSPDWEIEYGVSGFAQGAGTIVTTGVTNPYTLSGLTSNTDYDVYVRANCGSGDFSSWSGPLSFATACTSISNLNENFDSLTTPNLPNCWTTILENASTSSYIKTTTNNVNSSPNGLQFYSSYDAASDNLLVVLPIMSNISSSSHRLKFSARNTGGTDIMVGTITNPNDASTFTSIETIELSTTHTEYVINFSNYSGTDNYIAIKQLFVYSGYNSLYLDDFVWEPLPTTPPTCSVISSPADEATSVSVTTSLSWSANIDATGYKLKIGSSSGASDFLTETDLGNVTTYDPTDFAYNTEYFVTLTAYNTNGDAASCTETSFTTDDGCITPSSPSIGSLGVSLTPSITWSASSVVGETGFVISIGTTAGGTDVLNAHDNGTSTSYSASGLNYETVYFVTVKAKNAQGTTSAACTGYSFTTKAAPQSLPYTQDFEDDTSEIVISGTNTNKFYIGTAANNGGAKSLYVSDDSGTSNEYNTGSTSTAWATVDVDLTGHSAATLSFDWRCDGEDNYDYGEVWINIGASDVRITDSKEFVASTTYQNKTIDLSTYTGNVATIKFKWYNDGSVGSQPPLSIDNISIVDPTIVWASAAWSNTTGPTASDNAMVNDDLTLTADLNCADLTIATGKTLTVAPGTVLNVTGDLTNNGSVVFASNATGTGTFGTYTGAAIAGTGSATVEQHVGAKRAWRMLTSPLKGAANNMVYDNWQNAGTQVTGTGMNLFSAAGGNGLHAGGGSFSIKKYPTSGTATAWIDVTNTQTEPLFDATKNNSFVVFTTGPYTTAATNITSGSAETVYNATGNLITGDVTYTSLPTDVHSFIGNPYVSPIDPAALFADNTAFTKLWVWDPSLSTVGGYLAYDSGSGWSNESASYSNTSGSETMIQSGQAFFVKPATTSTLTIKESHKSSMVDNGVFFKTSSSNVEQIRVVLSKEVNGTIQNEDAAVVTLYNDGDNAVTVLDAEKMTKGGENISILTNQNHLTVEHRATAQMQDEVQFYLYGMNDSDVYNLKVYTKDYAGLQPYLWDTLNDTYHIIPTDDSAYNHSFTMLDPNTEKERFRVVFDATLSTTINQLDQISMYPNPINNGKLTIALPNNLTDINYRIVNMLGQTVKQGLLNSGVNQLEINAATGVYNVIINSNGQSTTKKILIK